MNISAYERTSSFILCSQGPIFLMQVGHQLEFSCPCCDESICFSVIGQSEEKCKIVCTHCHKNYSFNHAAVQRLQLFEALCHQIHLSKPILNQACIAVDISQQKVKIPFNLLLTRLNAKLEMFIGEKKVAIAFRFNPIHEALSFTTLKTLPIWRHEHQLRLCCHGCSRNIDIATADAKVTNDVICLDCHTHHALCPDVLHRLQLFEALCKQIHLSQSILSQACVAVDLGQQQMKFPFDQLMTRLNAMLDMVVAEKVFSISFCILSLHEKPQPSF